MMSAAPPFTMSYDLAALPDRGTEIVLDPGPAERAAIAAWLGAEGVDRLQATIQLTRRSDDRYRYEARFAADVVQSCVVTLEPVTSHLEGSAERDIEIKRRLPARFRDESDEDTVETDDGDDGLEILDTTVFDLAAPVLEELSLSLDPYPRAPGVAFEPPKDEPGASSSPFAVLAKLKENKTQGPQKSAAQGAKAPKAKPKT